MTNTVLIKRSSVANSVPLAGNLQSGELAINYNDGNLFYKNTSNVVTVIASNKFSSVSGNVTGGNIITSGVVSTSGIVGTGNIDFVSSGNISLGNVGNIHISGGSSGYVLSTNGSGNLTWVAQSGGSGGSTITVDDFTGDGSTTQFTLSVTPPGIDNTTVNYNGVIQLRTGYTLSGANIVFATPPVSGSSIEVTSLSATISGAAGSNTQIQFNDGGNTGASANLTFDKATNVLSVVGNASATYFIGNGSLLTGISAGSSYSNANVADYLASGSDSSNIVTTANVTGGNILTGGQVSATGNITGNYVLGNAAFMTGIPASYGNANVVANLAALGSNPVSTTGNITSGNLLTSGLISATSTITSAANITGGNILTAGLISAAGNITGGNVVVAGGSGGNLTGANVISANTFTATANITGGNLLTGGLASASGNITGGNILTGGQVSATGNVTGGNVNTNNLVGTALTVTSTGNLNLAPTGNINADSHYINAVSDPVQNQDVATKNYVDTMVSSGIAYHQPVTAATTTTLATTTGGTITYTQPNGAGNGIGAYISTTGSFNLIDTANVQTANTRILVKNEANAVLNGVYYWANATTIVRTSDADEYGPDSTIALSLNDYFFVQSGNVNAGSAYVVASPSGTITFGTSNITFSQFSSSQTYTANTSAGVSLTGTVFSAKVDNTTTAFDGSGNIIVKSGAVLTTPNIGEATGTSLSVTGNVDSGNLRTNGVISATSNITGGNVLTGGIISATGNITGGNILGGANVNATTHTGTTVSVTANITGGNILTGGIISATGNIKTGGNLVLQNGAIVTDTASGGIAIGSSAGNTSSTYGVAIGYNAGQGQGSTAAIAIGINAGQTNQGSEGVAIGSWSGGGHDSQGASAIAIGHNTGQTNQGAYSIAIGASAGQDNQGAESIAIGAYAATGLSAQANNSIVISALGAAGQGAQPYGNIASSFSVAPVRNVSSGNVVQYNAETYEMSYSNSLSLAGNITGGNLLTSGLISATANITGGNIRTAGLVTATGNVTGGNLLTSGAISATGNVTGNYFIGNGSQLTGITSTATPAGSNTQIQFNDGGSLGASANLTFDKTTNTLNATTVTANGVPLATTGKAIAMAIVFGF